ncbi:MAG TPA: sigma-70 family RNA polymerase sigma factor [Candidatus Limnocylindrales bacterium]|nr:sigma-70 family RNA polymerase sigma factor [Candidatus Limnocylindrales bacterium]
MSPLNTDSAPVAGDRMFITTHWTAVITAGDSAAPGAREALEKLCQIYWYPLYAFIRRKGYPPQEAEDLTQSFFARFLEKRYLHDVAPEKGRFRTFLLCSLNHFLANEWDKSQRLKRGGGLTFLPLETPHAEDLYNRDQTQSDSPENAFDRHWAARMLEVVLSRLRAEFDGPGHLERFSELKPFLLGEPNADGYAAIAARLQLSEQGVKSAVHRLRQRFRELFREEISSTVATRAEIDEELRYLVRLMTS